MGNSHGLSDPGVYIGSSQLNKTRLFYINNIYYITYSYDVQNFIIICFYVCFSYISSYPIKVKFLTVVIWMDMKDIVYFVKNAFFFYKIMNGIFALSTLCL